MVDLSNLNEKQKEAVQITEGPVLIVAGAGAGKTKTITTRIANIIDKGTNPQEILAVTFTNKAAKEMKERTLNLLGKRLNNEPLISTFHSLAVYILRKHGDKIGINKNFLIIDKNDGLSKVKQLIKNRGYDPKEHEPQKILSNISFFKNKGLSQADYENQYGINSYQGELINKIWIDYNKLLKQENSLDFDDLLLKNLWLLKESQEVRNHYQNCWQYLHIDEYQDTNKIQYELAKILAEKHSNICVVGDIDQSIYSWRGADYENIIRFEKDYPNSKVLVLEENYRSTQVILEVANEIISKNKNRTEKKLFTKKEQGELVSLEIAANENHEAKIIAQKIIELKNKNFNLSEIAILYRANFLSRPIEEEMIKNNIPYKIAGTKFLDRKEVKDMLAYLRYTVNPNDMDSLKRAIAFPSRGIGKVTLVKFASGYQNEITGTTGKKLDDFLNFIELIRQKLKTENIKDILLFILKEGGVEESLNKQKEEDLDRLANIYELISLAEKYNNQTGEEGILNLLTDTALMSDQDSLDEKNQAVNLMTIHAAKGLEFDVVFLIGLEQGIFPSENKKNKDSDQEEERRLCYVALTRAKKKIYLSYTQIRHLFGSPIINTPSEFLLDIPSDLIDNPNYQPDSEEIEYLII